jgi:hypothetical protein
MYTNGSESANKFIEKYKKLGYLVDIYSKEYIASKESDDFPKTVEDLMQLEKSFGSKHQGHLLTIYLGDENQELLKDMADLYEPFNICLNSEGRYGGWSHKPDFVFINLNTKEILCIGLGRKNRIFHFELHKYISSLNSQDKIDLNVSDEFAQLDYWSIVKNTLKEVEILGSNFFEHCNLRGNADVYVEINNDDGLYYFEGEDEDGLTEEEVEELRAEYEKYDEWIDDSIRELREFFPMIEDWELSTGDF